MRYWVYGVDLTTKDPRDPLIIEAISEEAARAQAKDLGMAVEEVEAAQPLTTVDVAPSDYPLANALVHVFRLLAVVSGFLSALAVFKGMELVEADLSSRFSARGIVAALNAMLQGIVIVSILLAAAEGLRLAIAIERNTRKRKRLGPEAKAHRRSK
jgi:hypothetical protein